MQVAAPRSRQDRPRPRAALAWLDGRVPVALAGRPVPAGGCGRLADAAGRAADDRRGADPPRPCDRRMRRGRSSTRTARPTIRCSWATWPPRASASSARSPPASAVCVHGDYDADGICATALAVIVLRGLGAKVESHLPSRFDEGYGLAVETVERLAGDGVSPARHRRLRHHGRRRGGPRARELGDGRHRHRPPPAGRRAARVHRGCAPARPSIRSRSCAAPASCSSWPRRCTRGPAATRPSSSSTSTWSPSRRSPTSCPFATRTAASCARACAGCGGRRSPACAR